MGWKQQRPAVGPGAGNAAWSAANSGWNSTFSPTGKKRLLSSDSYLPRPWLVPFEVAAAGLR